MLSTNTLERSCRPYLEEEWFGAAEQGILRRRRVELGKHSSAGGWKWWEAQGNHLEVVRGLLLVKRCLAVQLTPALERGPVDSTLKESGWGLGQEWAQYFEPYHLTP